MKLTNQELALTNLHTLGLKNETDGKALALKGALQRGEAYTNFTGTNKATADFFKVSLTTVKRYKNYFKNKETLEVVFNEEVHTLDHFSVSEAEKVLSPKTDKPKQPKKKSQEVIDLQLKVAELEEALKLAKAAFSGDEAELKKVVDGALERGLKVGTEKVKASLSVPVLEAYKDGQKAVEVLSDEKATKTAKKKAKTIFLNAQKAFTESLTK